MTSGHNLKILPTLAILVFTFLLVPVAGDNAFGHGVGSETFPPVELDGRLVTLEVSSSQSDPKTSDDQQISISLIDFDSKITLRDVTFLIKSERGENFLFEQKFLADNGFVVFNFQSSDDTGSILVEEQNEDGFFGSLLGLESRKVNVKGPNLSEGGLYRFDVSVLSADGYSNVLDEPLVFNAGISIPQTSSHSFNDPNYGEQSIDVITYYDEISDFEYDPQSKSIRFSMPFEWSLSNINQTSVVHEEITIPKDFGDLLVSGFTMDVNDVKLSEDIVNIDDFFTDERTVHFIIYQKELLKIFETNPAQNGMNFVITPDRDYPHLSSVTENGQFRILVSWEPEYLRSGQNAKILFDVTDIFLKNKPVSVDYSFSVTKGDKTIFEQTGTSTDSKEQHNIVEFVIPSDVSGIISLNFDNLDGNSLAQATIPIVVDRQGNNVPSSIPDWIRNNAGWWSSGQIDDETFAQGIEYLIKNGIIVTSAVQKDTSGTEEIPDWIRNNAGWWSSGQIDDETFSKGLEFLVKNGIIRV